MLINVKNVKNLSNFYFYATLINCKLIHWLGTNNMQILPLNTKVNYQLQNQNSQKGNVNFGALPFVATPEEYKEMARIFPGSKPLTAFVKEITDAYNLGGFFTTQMKKWLPVSQKDSIGKAHIEQDFLLNRFEVYRLRKTLSIITDQTRVASRHGGELRAEDFNPIKRILESLIPSIKAERKTVTIETLAAQNE